MHNFLATCETKGALLLTWDLGRHSQKRLYSRKNYMFAQIFAAQIFFLVFAKIYARQKQMRSAAFHR
jgi:hypothetical protein